MKVIEIRNTQRGEVAYLWDDKSQSVLKVWVKDFTRENSQPEYNQEEEQYEEVEVAPVPMPSPRIANTVRIPKKLVPTTRVEIPIGEDGLPDLPRAERPKPSVIPPALRGVFIPADSPGAAVERRKV